MQIFYDKDCDLSIIQGKKVAILVTVLKVMHMHLTLKTQA